MILDFVVWDKLEANLAKLVLINEMPFGDAIGTLSRENNDKAAESLLLAGISFCAHYDQLIGFNDANTMLNSLRRYRIIACLAADIAAVPSSSRTCGNLVKHWISTDDRVFSKQYTGWSQPLKHQ